MSLQREYVLRPANPALIAFSLGSAFVLNLLPWGRDLWVPDFLAMTLIFWHVEQARRMGFGVSFLLGLLMDIHDGALLGEHALAYSLLAYMAATTHRRMHLQGPLGRMMQAGAILLITRLAIVLVRSALGGPWPGWGWFVPVITSALAWPLVEYLLLAPQRQPLARDENRPL